MEYKINYYDSLIGIKGLNLPLTIHERMIGHGMRGMISRELDQQISALLDECRSDSSKYSLLMAIKFLNLVLCKIPNYTEHEEEITHRAKAKKSKIIDYLLDRLIQTELERLTAKEKEEYRRLQESKEIRRKIENAENQRLLEKAKERAEDTNNIVLAIEKRIEDSDPESDIKKPLYDEDFDQNVPF